MATAIANEDLTLIRRLRFASFVEASTLLALLLVAVPLKHVLGYAIATVSGGGDWTRRELARLIVAAFIPFGGFANAGLLRRKQAAAAHVERR